MLSSFVSDPSIRASIVISLASFITSAVNKFLLDTLSAYTFIPYLTESIGFREEDSLGLSEKIIHLVSLFIWLKVMRTVSNYYVRNGIHLKARKVSAFVAASYALVACLFTMDNLNDPTTIMAIAIVTTLIYIVMRNDLKREQS